MSYSNPRQTNPAKKTIEWSGSKGHFEYYDAETKAKKQIGLPVFFVVLDEFSTVSGYHKKSKSGIMANEVRNTLTDMLHVRSYRAGVSEKGLWQDIKDPVTSEGAKYCKSVYALMITKEGSELVRFLFSGCSFSGADTEKKCLSGWINAKFNKEQYGVQVKNTEDGKNGSTEFIAPVFSAVNIPDKYKPMAVEADRELQGYMSDYLSRGVDVVKEATEKETHDDTPDLPPSENLGLKDAPPENDEVDDLPF